LQTANSEEHYDWAWILESLLSEAGRYQEALQHLDQTIARYPDNVRPLITKASLHFLFSRRPGGGIEMHRPGAGNSLSHRLSSARSSRRESADIVQQGQGEQLSEVLDEIVSLRMIEGIPDIRRERDFVDRAPPGLISDDLRARYDRFCPKRSGE
jgi:hypothetical protein